MDSSQAPMIILILAALLALAAYDLLELLSEHRDA